MCSAKFTNVHVPICIYIINDLLKVYLASDYIVMLYAMHTCTCMCIVVISQPSPQMSDSGMLLRGVCPVLNLLASVCGHVVGTVYIAMCSSINTSLYSVSHWCQYLSAICLYV